MQTDHGVTISAGPFGTNSRPALITAKFAEAQGKSEVYHDAVHRAYWVEARDISHLAVLKDILQQTQLDSAQLETVLKDPVYQSEVDEDIALAREHELSGVPAMVFDNKYLIVGAQPYPTLVRAMKQVLAEQSQK